MPFDTSTRLYNLLAKRINAPIRNEKRSDTNCIKPMLSICLIETVLIQFSTPIYNRVRF